MASAVGQQQLLNNGNQALGVGLGAPNPFMMPSGVADMSQGSSIFAGNGAHQNQMMGNGSVGGLGNGQGAFANANGSQGLFFTASTEEKSAADSFAWGVQ